MAAIPATSVEALRNGFIEGGFPPNAGIGITETLADARTLFLTPNATVVYEWACVDVEKGPMVVESPPAVLGIINDAYFRFLSDMGQFGPDESKGGKFLLVRDDYSGPLPTTGYYVVKTRTNNNLLIIRAFVRNGDLAGTVTSVKASTKLYPFSAAANPPAQKFVNISGAKRGGAARAGQLRRSGHGRSVCSDRDQEREAVRARCKDEGALDRRRCRR
jgi:hypothetical protein